MRHFARWIGRTIRAGRASRTLLPIAVFTAAALQAQLNTTTHTQMPSMVIEPVVVKLSGVYPLKIVRPKGPFILYIENRLPGHAAHFSLTLNQANAPELIGLDTAVTTPRSHLILDLLPNTYVLHIQNQGISQNINSQSRNGMSVAIQITN